MVWFGDTKNVSKMTPVYIAFGLVYFLDIIFCFHSILALEVHYVWIGQLSNSLKQIQGSVLFW